MALPTRPTISLSTLLLCGGEALAAQSAGVSGTVLDASTRLPVPNTVVEITSQGRRAETDSVGGFRLLGLSPQMVTVRIRSIGYRAVERSLNLFAGRVVTVEYLIAPNTVTLAEVEVTGRDMSPTALMMEGFEERRRLGIGKYYTEADIARHRQRQVPDLLRDAPSLLIQRGRSNEYYAVSARRSVTTMTPGNRNQRPCFLDIFMDGNVVWSADRGARGVPPVDLAHFVDLTDLVGVEVYSGVSTVPAEFRRQGSNCGAIIFWTRRGGTPRDTPQ